MIKILMPLFGLVVTVAKAQVNFISKGKIEFEKQINIHKEIDADWGDEEDDNIWKQNFKKNTPKVQTVYYNLFFDNDKTIFKAGRESNANSQKIPDWLSDRNLDNIVYNNISAGQTISQKAVYETNFLLTDSLRHINWRITNDFRTIAGIECRKAIGVIMDSVYVIAFYTDIIECSGGPESFTGLPGMILGVAIPRINTTWFATKVELINVNETDLIPPKKGKKVTYKELEQQLKTALKSWGKYANRSIWKMLI
jgi:GLPGLI family protein